MKPGPNLLFIFSDEHAVSAMGSYGNRLISTPNLDRLAGRGVLFERAYVTQPVCTPSRASIMTGLFPHRCGCTANNIPLRASARCLPELADFAGYRTAYHGKWHLGDEIFRQHGFDEWIGIDDDYFEHYRNDRDPYAASPYHRFLVERGHRPDLRIPEDRLKRAGFNTLACGAEKGIFSRSFCARLPEEETKAAFVADATVEFLARHGDDPFVLYANFFEPHMPYFGPRDGQYDPAAIPLPPNFDDEPDGDHPLKLRCFADAYRRKGHSGYPLETERDWREMIGRYWGLASLVDAQVGRILDALDRQGLWENTIVVYTSDHGDMMGSHRLIAKCVMYEEAVRVPLVVHLPGSVGAGRRVADPVSQVDLVPTMLDLLGRPVPDGLDGRSWKGMLLDGEPLAESDVVVEWNDGNTGCITAERPGAREITGELPAGVDAAAALESVFDPVRTIVTPEGWKYNRSSRGEDELYHLAEDPGETRNLAGDPARRVLVEELRGRIRRWQARTADAARWR